MRTRQKGSKTDTIRMNWRVEKQGRRGRKNKDVLLLTLTGPVSVVHSQALLNKTEKASFTYNLKNCSTIKVSVKTEIVVV